MKQTSLGATIAKASVATPDCKTQLAEQAFPSWSQHVALARIKLPKAPKCSFAVPPSGTEKSRRAVLRRFLLLSSRPGHATLGA